MKKLAFILILLVTLLNNLNAQERWNKEKADAWYAKHDWITGANFIPSTAINQLEMWQENSFDSETIDRELGYAEGIGFNTMRVYLHSLAYKADPKGFKNRVDTYLKLAAKHKIKTIFVIFDDVWDAKPEMGKQRAPKPGVHNSGWMQDPGYPASNEMATSTELKKYVQDIIRTFKDDDRVLFWDLYNEPGNSGKKTESLPLLKNVFAWAREINPSQPLSAGLWDWSFTELNAYQAQHSDIITYHDYEDPEWHRRVIQLLKSHDRPMICTEYMARTRDNRFSNTLPMLAEYNIGAINWGLVNGKTNTIYAWDTPIESGEEPLEWFHDIFRKDGTPYRNDEVNLIKKLNLEYSK
jgi:endo-1,4-beta-mannosidase